MRPTDEEVEHSLRAWSQSILAGNANPRLLRVLQAECGQLRDVFLINYIPEQGEDIFVVATSPTTVLVIEVSRVEPAAPAVLTEKCTLKAYWRNCSKGKRRTIVAIERLLKESASQ